MMSPVCNSALFWLVSKVSSTPTGQNLLLQGLFLIRLSYCDTSLLPFLFLPYLSPINSVELTILSSLKFLCLSSNLDN